MLIVPLLVRLMQLGLLPLGTRWSSYRRTTLRELKRRVKPPGNAHDVIIGTRHTFPSRVRLAYEGESRPIPPWRLDLIAGYCSRALESPQIAGLFQREYRFAEGADRYWLPVQRQVAAHLDREVGAGGEAEVFLIWIGGRQQRGRFEWLFLVNEFEAIRDERRRSIAEIP